MARSELQRKILALVLGGTLASLGTTAIAQTFNARQHPIDPLARPMPVSAGQAILQLRTLTTADRKAEPHAPDGSTGLKRVHYQFAVPPRMATLHTPVTHAPRGAEHLESAQESDGSHNESRFRHTPYLSPLSAFSPAEGTSAGPIEGRRPAPGQAKS